MAITGLDYSAGRIAGAAIKAAGYDFAIRYVEDPARQLWTKHLRPDEYRDLIGAGVHVWAVFEVDTTDALGGFAQGTANARRALAGAAWVGYPADQPIFFCSDRHLSSGEVLTALAYLDGAAAVLGRDRVGAYGFFEFIDAAIAGNHAAAYWQCGIRPAATGPVHLWQRNDTSTTVGGIGCDINVMMHPLAPLPPQPAAPPPQRIDMTPDESRKLSLIYSQLVGPDAAADTYPGWSTDRWGTPNEQLTVVMFLQRIERQLNSSLDLSGRPTAGADNAFGQVLSLRSEVRALTALLDPAALGRAVAAALPVEAELTAAQVQQAVKDAIAASVHVTGTLNVAPTT